MSKPNQFLIVGVVAAVLITVAFVVGPTRPSPTPNPQGQPIIAFERFESSPEGTGAIFRFSNPSQNTVYFFGYNEESPQLWIQIHTGYLWQDYHWDWCGTGLELRSAQPGRSFEFKVDKWRLHPNQPMRVGTGCEHDDTGCKTWLWSDVFEVAASTQLDHKR